MVKDIHFPGLSEVLPALPIFRRVGLALWAQIIAGVDLVSLGMGRLSVSHALLHFGR